MNQFSIRDIENMTGIKAHTLRIWEQRYHLLIPKRKESKHRIYDNEDLKQMLRISYLYHSGCKISKIAAMSEEEIRKHSLEILPQNNFTKVFMNRMTEAAIDFDQLAFEQVIQNVFIHLGFEKAMTEVIYPFLEKMGLLWLTDNVIPAQEHFSSNLIRKKMLVAIDGLGIAPPDPNRTVLMFTPEGELHEIPMLFMKYVFRKNHIPVIYFGTNVPLQDIFYFCGLKDAAVIYCHIITSLAKTDINDYCDTLCKRFPGKKIVISGPQTHAIRSQHPNLILLKSMNDTMKFAKTMA